jgi:hypothetical protein
MNIDQSLSSFFVCYLFSKFSPCPSLQWAHWGVSRFKCRNLFQGFCVTLIVVSLISLRTVVVPVILPPRHLVCPHLFPYSCCCWKFIYCGWFCHVTWFAPTCFHTHVVAGNLLRVFADSPVPIILSRWSLGLLVLGLWRMMYRSALVMHCFVFFSRCILLRNVITSCYVFGYMAVQNFWIWWA